MIDSCNAPTKLGGGGAKKWTRVKQTIVVNPAIVLVVELLVVFKISADEDF